jgi:hypothetical protein
VVVGVFYPAALSLAQAPGQPSRVSAYTLTPKRMLASSSALVGLIGTVVGGLALARSRARVGPGQGRRGAILSLVMGPVALVVGGVVVVTANGGPGTGNGIAGGFVAIVLGLTATSLGAMVVSRARRVT